MAWDHGKHQVWADRSMGEYLYADGGECGAQQVNGRAEAVFAVHTWHRV